MTLKLTANQATGPAAPAVTTRDDGVIPKVALIWNGAQASTGASAGTQMNIGAMTTLGQVAAGYNSQDNVATSSCIRVITNANVIANKNFATTTGRITAARSFLNAGGLGINWVTVSTASPLYNYLVLGGSDVTASFVGQYTMNTSIGNQSVTGIGFKPDVVIMWATLNTTNTAQQNATQLGFGAMDKNGNQWSICQKAQHLVSPSSTNRAFSNVSCLVLTQTAANGFAHKQTFVSMDADGFTVNIGTALGTASLVNFIAIKGGLWKVGTDTQNTTTGTKSTTGVGFTPSGAIFGSVCDTTTDAVSTNARFCLGASSGASNNVAVWTGDTNAVTPTVCNTITNNANCLVLATEGAAASPTTNASAAVSSFDTDGFTLNWGTADATARQFGYIAFGSTSTAEQGYLKQNAIRPHLFSPGLAR